MDGPESPIVAEARGRAREALSALAAAEVFLAESRRRGDLWGCWDGLRRIEAAGWHYAQADSWLVRCLLGRID